MPFRNATGFDLETLKLMTAAYDSVVAKLDLKPGDPRTSKLAMAIVQLVKDGVIDPDKLTDQARASLK